MSDAPIEKLMSLTLWEFQKSLMPLIGAALPAAADTAVIAIGQGQVEIRFEALPPARLSGLMSMPQARVILTFRGVSSDAQAAFIRRFDIAFQRGGG
jgi:hypothetical protein